MTPNEIRRTAIIAMFSDDELMEHLVLKGGNALDIVHGLSARGSLDIDFSIENDFADLKDIQERIFKALRDRFDSAGALVFDERFLIKPSVRREGLPEQWGGYRVEFKVISKEVASRLEHSLDHMRRQAEIIGFQQEKTFHIEISKYEYCEGKVEAELDAYKIFVYTPEMIAAEKVRAICQQMAAYPLGTKSARARDFYDIHSIVTGAYVDFSRPEFHDLVRAVFEAKTVPLQLLREVKNQRGFHAPDWPKVELAISDTPQSFDFYFDFVVAEVEKLKSLWEV